MSSPKQKISSTVPYIDESKVASVLRMQDLIPAMEQALIDFSAGRVLQPVRTIVSVPEQHGFMGVMPAVYGDAMGSKVVNFYPQNGAKGLPTHLALICMFRSDTGLPIAILDGRLITEMRTAAVTAVAVRALSSPQASSLAILGSGVQARAHFRALSLVRNLREVRVWSPTPEHARQCAEEIGAIVTTAEDAAGNSDIVVTVTSSSVPILRGEWLRPGAFVAAVGSVGSTRREVDDKTVLNAAVVVDSRDAAAQEAGDILIPGAPIYAELGDLLAGTRRSPHNARVVFKSLGIAVEDIAAARMVLKQLGLWN